MAFSTALLAFSQGNEAACADDRSIDPARAMAQPATGRLWRRLLILAPCFKDKPARPAVMDFVAEYSV